jgi:TetR/AcrR family transcriptional repressor of nem operon
MRKGDETKERIKEAALNLFHFRGYSGTSMSDIIESTGVKKGNLYFHYLSKESLAVEVLKGALTLYEEHITGRIQGISSADKLESLINAVAEFHINGNYRAGCIFGNMALETGGAGSEISEFVKDVFMKWENNFEKLLSRGVKEGDLVLRETPRVFARMIISSIEGGLMLSKIYGKIDPFLNCTEFILSALEERRSARSLNRGQRGDL